MRHRRRTRRLGVKTAHRKSMLRNMVTSLIEHDRIVTTLTRAKELRRLADHMVTLAKDGSLHARRQALSVVRSKAAVAKLFDEIGPQMEGKNGGYTRIIRKAPRRGDAAVMSIIEFATDQLDRPAGHGKAPKAREADIQQDQGAQVIPQAVQEESVPTDQGDEAVPADQDEGLAAGSDDSSQVESGEDDAGASPGQEGEVEGEQDKEEPVDSAEENGEAKDDNKE